ncbi:sarcosine oxidase subunit gamma family protein [Maritimibacter sp. UBA3975]|uniref:sarcosine oxidase subunit gamma n=1 Tax=Maritimibacter sp. UBA3975 TaxID=1946833 RepID=UPI000C0A96EA|nr:sarcosine oxidase subunit gamma family protein [Maritimibacter sp. UBA3975]MAM62261.1 sarcosine oxidase subunit gamma [Maritimibacter sp.]
MTDLTPVTALGASTARRESFGPLTITEVPDVGLASLALRQGQAVPTPFGLTLPAPGRAVTGKTASAFWTGPDQWMIEGPGQGEADFAARVRDEAPGCIVTEQTDGFVVVEITSDAGAAPLEALMEMLVNVDPGTFGPGQATRTAMHHLTVFLLRRAEDRLSVLVMRSFARAAWHALAETAGRQAR